MKNKYWAILGVCVSLSAIAQASDIVTSAAEVKDGHSLSQPGYDALVLLDATWQQNRSIVDAKEIYRRLHGSQGIAAPATDVQREVMLSIARRNAAYFAVHPDQIPSDNFDAIKSSHKSHFDVLDPIYEGVAQRVLSAKKKIKEMVEKQETERKALEHLKELKKEEEDAWNNLDVEGGAEISGLTARIEQENLLKAAEQENAKKKAAKQAKLKALQPKIDELAAANNKKVGATVFAGWQKHSLEARAVRDATTKAEAMKAVEENPFVIKKMQSNIDALQKQMADIQAELAVEKARTHKVHNADLTGAEAAKLAHALIKGIDEDESWKAGSAKDNIIGAASKAGFRIALSKEGEYEPRVEKAH